MVDAMRSNETFLRNIYEQGPLQGHGFCCQPAYDPPPCELGNGDYTTSALPVDRWVPTAVANYRKQLDMLEAMEHDGVPSAKLTTGTHIYAAAFGCDVHATDEDPPFALPVAHNAAEAERLAEPDIWQSPSLARVFELAERLQAELGRDAYLSPPDVQSGFDTACLVWNKEDLYCAMLMEDERDAVKRLVDKCARLLKTFLGELRREFPQMHPGHCPGTWVPPDMGIWLSNDECGAIGNETFEEFCLPELVDLADTFDGFGMHCCADAEHQFELFKRIPGFYAFNRVAARHGYQPILDHFGGPGNPVHVLAWVDPQETERLIREAPQGTRFIFEATGLELDEAKAWYAKMRELSPRTSD